MKSMKKESAKHECRKTSYHSTLTRDSSFSSTFQRRMEFKVLNALIPNELEEEGEKGREFRFLYRSFELPGEYCNRDLQNLILFAIERVVKI
ncbi:hypothetical protein CEXT_165601 [Caerostris extrusa]|uniref:Uncharacterized protein n=1 Tax=Caerostris extrusa TaxID=172846 RepID=A0AAV4RKQ0_CAEEX|nr:hypothetical protein CEXT_165601 [Caerostris extrusa]